MQSLEMSLEPVASDAGGTGASLEQKIKHAFKNKDAAASRAAHESKYKKRGKFKPKYNSTGAAGDPTRTNNLNLEDYVLSKEEHDQAETKHKGDAGEFIKSIIFGGLDGIITLFAIVASISGSDLAVETVLVLGFAKLVGDGISMGIGDFLSEKAEIDFTKSEFLREKWEFDNFREGEIKEMIEIYKDKGIAEKDATIILTTMAKYPAFFLDHMMMEELELDTSVMDDNPMKNGAITFTSFLIFGTIPLLSYLIFYGWDIDVAEGETDWKLILAIILTCVTMFAMGAVKGFYCNGNVIASGFFVMLNGSIAAGSAYFVGWGLAVAFGIED